MSVTGPRYNINAIQKLNEHELRNLTPKESSWHRRYRDSSYIFIGGLDTRLTEGDVVIVFSQWGDPVDVNIVRDKDSGKSKGFCFLAYEDQRSTDIAVDNANGMTLLSKLLRVDHVLDYKPPEQVASAKDTTTKREGVKKEGEGVKKEQRNEKTEKKDKEEEEEVEEEPEPYRATGPEGKGIGVYGSVGNGKVLKSVAAVYSSSRHYSEKRIKTEERQRGGGASSSWSSDNSKRRRHDDSIQESSRQPAKCPW